MRNNLNENRILSRMSRRFAVFIAVLLMVAGLAALSGITAHGQEAQKNGKSDGIMI